MTVRFGVHLPLIDFGGEPWTAARLSAYVREAAALGFDHVCANDHLLFRRPWLDGPTSLAAVLDASADMMIATTVVLPVIRGPVHTATMLAALHTLSGGRLIAGVGPGSSAADFAAAGIPFAERWKRFDESVRMLRVLLGHDESRFRGRFYSTDGIDSPVIGSSPPPPLWISSWGSPAGIRRVAELGDGWLASAYNTSPPVFRDGVTRLEASGRPGHFPAAVATTWLHVTDRADAAGHVIDDLLAPTLGRPADDLRAAGLPIGSPEQCAERIDAYIRAGAERIFLWPIGDEIRQLAAFRTEVVPLLTA